MFDGDNDTYEMAKTMCLRYLEIYPSEKKFKLLTYKKLKSVNLVFLEKVVELRIWSQ